MPELPEVETVVRGLKRTLIGKSICKIQERYPRTITNQLGMPLSRVQGGDVLNVRRRGKYIRIDTSTLSITIHLRMTGKLLWQPRGTLPGKYTRALFGCRDGSLLFFDDIRTFGTIQLSPRDQPIAALSTLGPEPLASGFDAPYLYHATRTRSAPVKNLLLTQSLVAGLGNIYVCEALYRARIDPTTAGHRLDRQKCARLVLAIRHTLTQAIAMQGTSVSDYRTIYDQSGSFQDFLMVYKQKECPQGHSIRRIKQAGRSTFYCPTCQ